MKSTRSKITMLLLAPCTFALASAPGKAAQSPKTTTYDWVLSPAAGETQVPVERSVMLQLMRQVCNGYEFSDGYPSAMLCARKQPTAEELASISVEWLVNGSTQGAAIFGSVRPLDGAVPFEAVYTAPASVPGANPVDVSVTIRTKGAPQEVQLVRQMRIVDYPGWRGNIQVNIVYSHDPELMRDDMDGGAQRADPIYSITNKDRPIDRTMIESNLVYTVTDTLSESVDDEGNRLVVLQARPSGTMNFSHQVNRHCQYGLDIAKGTLSSIYDTVPLTVMLEAKPSGATTIRMLPGVGFDVQGLARMDDCVAAYANAYENFWDGVTFANIDTDVPDIFSPVFSTTSITGRTRTPAIFRYGGEDYGGEAEIRLSISRR